MARKTTSDLNNPIDVKDISFTVLNICLIRHFLCPMGERMIWHSHTTQSLFALCSRKIWDAECGENSSEPVFSGDKWLIMLRWITSWVRESSHRECCYVSKHGCNGWSSQSSAARCGDCREWSRRCQPNESLLIIFPNKDTFIMITYKTDESLNFTLCIMWFFACLIDNIFSTV